MELKEQLKQELLNQKEEKLKKAREENSKLQEITMYTSQNTKQLCETYKKFFTDNGIKFIEKDLNKYGEVSSTIQMTSAGPVIQVYDSYLVHGREFANPQQCINVLKHFANPDYVIPKMEAKIHESIKNLQNNIAKTLSQMNRQLMPIVRIMNQLAAEDKAEKENAKKNK
tara:strand:- start:47 stop:556 length:510 start_codon:yes stop_codon:yes gene_type:complete